MARVGMSFMIKNMCVTIMSEWVSVEDRLPTIREHVLTISKDLLYDYIVCHWDGSSWVCNCNCREGSYHENVTHWMPLPKPPIDAQNFIINTVIDEMHRREDSMIKQMLEGV